MKRIVEGRDSFNPNPNLSLKASNIQSNPNPKIRNMSLHTRKEVAVCSGREIHGHCRETILEKEKSSFDF
jgi:hypothetical protein